MYFVGVEGGTTGSRMVLLNEEGDILSRVEGDHTNQWQIGMDGVVQRIEAMLSECKRLAGVEGQIEALGLGLSGLDTDVNCRDMVSAVSSRNLAKHYFACNDTIITLATATDTSGIALISGTGSNCVLVRDDGSTVRSGGWGDVIPQNGSAYSIALSAIRTLINHEEGITPCHLDTSTLASCIKEYFNITDRMQLLEYLYDKFDTAYIAGLTKKLSEVAERGDALCQSLFALAGKELGRHIQAVVRSSQCVIQEPLTVVCTGNVFKSFEYLKDGFLQGIVPAYDGDVAIGAVRLLELRDTAAIGAAYLAAKQCQKHIVRQYDKMSHEFFCHYF